nr:hypothetical protein [Actinomadura geliboluensis]
MCQDTGTAAVGVAEDAREGQSGRDVDRVAQAV